MKKKFDCKKIIYHSPCNKCRKIRKFIIKSIFNKKFRFYQICIVCHHKKSIDVFELITKILDDKFFKPFEGRSWRVSRSLDFELTAKEELNK